MSAIPREAASVILLRDAHQGTQALLIRRHADLAFAGGTWVFPGGKLDPSDGTAAAMRRITGSRSAGGNANALSNAARGLVVAACRETFEETGILLARDAEGALCRPQLVESLQPLRTEISRNRGRFIAMLEENDLRVDSGDFVFWAHWITPSLVPRRFDTHFFAARMPPGQLVRCDSTEATECLWLDLRPNELPDESLLPAPPTRFSLADLAITLPRHQTLERLLSAEAGRYVAPVMPKMLRIDGRVVVLLPWDPEYQSAAGEGIAADVKMPEQYLRCPSRVFPSPKISGMPAA